MLLWFVLLAVVVMVVVVVVIGMGFLQLHITLREKKMFKMMIFGFLLVCGSDVDIKTRPDPP